MISWLDYLSSIEQILFEDTYFAITSCYFPLEKLDNCSVRINVALYREQYRGPKNRQQLLDKNLTNSLIREHCLKLAMMKLFDKH